MNPNLFKTCVASAVSARCGLQVKHVQSIIGHLIDLPDRPFEKKFRLSELGDVVIRNEPTTRRFPFAAEIEIPYKSIATFKVGDKFKKLTFHGLQAAKQDARGYLQLGRRETLITFGGLEGDDDVPIRIPSRKNSDAEKSGTGGRRRSGLV